MNKISFIHFLFKFVFERLALLSEWYVAKSKFTNFFLTKKTNVMKLEHKQAIVHYVIVTAIVVAGVLIANNWVQPMINSSKVAPPAGS